MLNRNKFLQLTARWWGKLWHFIFLSLKIKYALAVCLPICLSVKIWAQGILSDALDETGEGRNQSHWLILLTMLSLGERQAVSNGLRLKQEAGIWTVLRGSHILLRQRILQPETYMCKLHYWPSHMYELVAECAHTQTGTLKPTLSCTNTSTRWWTGETQRGSRDRQKTWETERDRKKPLSHPFPINQQCLQDHWSLFSLHIIKEALTGAQGSPDCDWSCCRLPHYTKNYTLFICCWER